MQEIFLTFSTYNQFHWFLFHVATWDNRDNNLKQNAHLLTAAELKRRGITRYDAEILLAQGVKLPEPRDVIQPLNTAPVQCVVRTGRTVFTKLTQRGKGGRFCKKGRRGRLMQSYEEMDSEISSTNGSETDPWSMSASSAEIKENITSSPAARRRNYSGAKGFRSPPRGELFGADDIVDFDDESSKVEERSRSRSGGRLSRGNKKLGLNPASKQNPTEKGTALVSPMSLPSDDVKIGDTVPLSADKGDENPDAKSSGSVNATPRRASLRSSRRRSQGEQMPRLRKERSLSSPTRGSGSGSSVSPVRETVHLRSAAGSSGNGKPMPVLIKEEPSSSDETLPDKQENISLPQRLFESSSSSGDTSDTMSTHSEFKFSATKRNLFDDMDTVLKNCGPESLSGSDNTCYDRYASSLTKKKRSKMGGSKLGYSISDSKLPHYETQLTSDLALKIHVRSNSRNPSSPKKGRLSARRYSENCYDSELVPQQDGKVPKITIRLRKGNTPTKNGEQDASVSTTTELSSGNSPGKTAFEPEYEIVSNCDNLETEGNNNNVNSNKRKWPSSPLCSEVKTGSLFSASTATENNIQQPKRIKIKFGQENVMDLHISPGKRKKIVEKVSS